MSKEMTAFVDGHPGDVVAKIYEGGMTVTALREWLESNMADKLRARVGERLAALKDAGVVDDKTTVGELIPKPELAELE